MNAQLDRVAFVAGSRAYSWGDVVQAARLRGDWAELEAQAQEGLACVKQAEERGEDPPAEEVDSAAVEFRYARELIAAEEMETWLEGHELSPESWLDYLSRSVLRSRHAESLPEIVARHPVSQEEVEGVLWCEGVCSGRLARFAQELAELAAVFDAAGEGPDTTVCPDLAELEAAFRRFREGVVTPKAIEDQLGSHHLDWVRVECSTLSFPEEESAREAALCLREDGRQLGEVAEEARLVVAQKGFYLEELGEELRDHFMGVRQGELLGPLEMDGEFVLFLVGSKVLPAREDPEVRQRAEREIVRRSLEREVGRRVRWVNPL